MNDHNVNSWPRNTESVSPYISFLIILNEATDYFSYRPTLSTIWRANCACREKRSHHHLAAPSVWRPKWSDYILPAHSFTVPVYIPDINVDINTTSHTLTNLEEHVEYIFMVAAATWIGVGPSAHQWTLLHWKMVWKHIPPFQKTLILLIILLLYVNWVCLRLFYIK